MKTSFINLPAAKERELAKIVEVIREQPEAKLAILFGSYARGNWVEELYSDGVHYRYQSDFDLLVVVETRKNSEQSRVEREIENAIDKLSSIHTPVSIIVHDFEFVNRRLAKAQYFFSDIKKEGILLHGDASRLIEPRQLNYKERYHLAIEDFDAWFDKGKRLTLGAQFYIDQKYYPEAAFSLHQATESLYSTILLVFTHYKPNTHKLENLRQLVNALDSRFCKIFPRATAEEVYRFDLLCRAYVEARYKPSYTITEEELDWLKQQIIELSTLTHELCQEKIAFFGRGGE